MIVYPEDIERKVPNAEKKSEWIEAIGLPFNLTAYYNRDKSFALYGKESEIIKLPNLTKREAECVIIGVIEVYRNIQSIMFKEGIID